VELDVCPLTATPMLAGTRPRGSQLGRIIEDRVDEAHVLSWPGALESFIPVHDTGGYDRARTPFGRFEHRLEQIKGTAGRSPAHRGELRISFDAPRFPPDPCLDFLFVRYDLARPSLTDPAFVVPSERLRAVCTPRACAHCRKTHWDFIANPAATSHDRARPFQVALRELALIRWSVGAPQSPPELSLLPVESGPFFERRFDADFLATSTGGEILLASDPDLFGRDRLIVDKRGYRWASLAIKGATQPVGTSNTFEVQVPRATFRAHPRHFLLIQYYDRVRARLHPWSWLLPSPTFAALATVSGRHLQFSSSLRAPNRWSPYRIPTDAVAARLRSALRKRSPSPLRGGIKGGGQPRK